MDGKRAAPGGPGDDEPSPPEASAKHAGGGEDELYGPLELERLRKDDGRTLIVFSRADGRR